MNHQKRGTLCASYLKRIVPQSSSLECYNFYDGDLEFGLLSHQCKIFAYTSSYYVYEFWNHIANPQDRDDIYNHLINANYISDDAIFSLLQETWHRKKMPNARAALFYGLSAVSSSGFASKGIFARHSFSPVLLERLRSYKKPPSFELLYTQAPSLEESVDTHSRADFWLFSKLSFGYNLFEEGKSWGVEETPVNHKKLRQLLRENDNRKWILSYYYHPALIDFFAGYHIVLIDGYGNPTSHDGRAYEVVIYNF